MSDETTSEIAKRATDECPVCGALTFANGKDAADYILADDEAGTVRVGFTEWAYVDTGSDATVEKVGRAIAAEQHCMHLDELPASFPLDYAAARAVLRVLRDGA